MPALSPMEDPFNLQRFVASQSAVHEDVVSELRSGSKQTHWMWFIFPQLRGLGSSPTSEHFGISSKAEALEYWTHPLLGARLRECVALVLAVDGRTALQIFGTPDELKFCSSMTLFSEVVPDERSFAVALEKYCGGIPDRRTLELLQ